MTLRAITLAVLAIVLAAPASVSGASASSQQTPGPKDLVLRQTTLLKQGRWRELYATYTLRFRQSCPYSTFVAQGREMRRSLGAFRLSGIQVRNETPTRAILAYSFVKNGRVIGRITFRHRDVYVKVGGRWLDERDRVTAC
jgi:hypothetical protein